jgi:tetratricopeptide (TPR) repeat protein
MGVRFDASSRTEVLERLFRERATRRLSAKLEGPASAISATVYLVAYEGRLVEVKAGNRKDIDALTVLALADFGEIEATPEAKPSREPARFPDGIGLYRQAAANAAEIGQLLAPLGGLAAVPLADFDRLADQAAQIPDAASIVLRLVDGRSTLAEVLARSPHDLRLTARILQRLAVTELVVPPATVAPEPIEEPSSQIEPSAQAETADTDVRAWLREPQPPAQLEQAFDATFARQTAERPMTPRPGTKDPLPASSRDEEEEFFRQAGVGGPSTARTWIVLVLAGAAIGSVIGLLIRGGDPPIEAPPPAPDATVAMTATTSTVATSTASSELGPDGRPPIAGPDAPEDVKRAERLLNAGRYQEARELLDQLRVTRADDPTVWILSGQVEVDVGRLTEADAMADSALKIDPKSYRGWVLKGSVLQFRGRFSVAKNAYERALSLDPNHPMTAEIQSVLEQMERNLSR